MAAYCWEVQLLLVRARLTHYRSAENSEEFEIEPDVTCLIGKNESGKTNILQGVYRVNPVEGSAAFDEVVDFPAWLTRHRKDYPVGERIPVAEATFVYEDDELEQIEKDLGRNALTSPRFTVTVGYRNSTKTFAHHFDEAAIVRHLCSSLALSADATAALVSQTTVKDLLATLDALPDAPAAVQNLAARIRGWRQQSAEHYLIDTYAVPWMPKFVYFDDYDTMPGKISIPDLIRRRSAGQLSRGERALLSLLTMAGVKPEDFAQGDRHEHLVRELENSGNVISDEVFRYWGQNKDLQVELKILQPETAAVPPMNEGPILQIRVYNRRHRVSVQFSERSRGFVWFFSFLAYFTEIEEAQTSNLILLLDEPGLSLHGRAQEDLLRLIDERLALRHQVIYTTHSPFMVSAGHFHRVRTVVDHEGTGTVVSAEIFKADEDTAFPLLTAMGIEMTQTLFIGEHTLLLEGPSDLIYLDVLSDLAESQGKPGLDPRWVKTPIGGSGKLSTFVTLLGANKLHVAVLIDSSANNSGAVRRLRENNQLAPMGLVEISEFTMAADADVEDLFDRGFYLDLVNRAYSENLPTPVTLADLNQNDPRIVRAIEVYFRDHNIAGGRFNHYRPAATLLRQQADLLPGIGQGTIDRAGQLFARLNSLLP